MSRFSLIAAVFLVLIKDGKVLMVRRQNSGWSDGDYDLVAGHVDGNEYLATALARETEEEIGITFDTKQAKLVHLSHFIGDKEYLNAAFRVDEWQGEPRIMEPHKHSDLRWFPLSDLPENITPATKAILSSYAKGEMYSETTSK
jgi:8-oxo-dGTP diphosphatase